MDLDSFRSTRNRSVRKIMVCQMSQARVEDKLGGYRPKPCLPMQHSSSEEWWHTMFGSSPSPKSSEPCSASLTGFKSVAGLGWAEA